MLYLAYLRLLVLFCVADCDVLNAEYSYDADDHDQKYMLMILIMVMIVIVMIMPMIRQEFCCRMASVEIVCLVITLFTRQDTTLVRRVMGTPETVKLHG